MQRASRTLRLTATASQPPLASHAVCRAELAGSLESTLRLLEERVPTPQLDQMGDLPLVRWVRLVGANALARAAAMQVTLRGIEEEELALSKAEADIEPELLPLLAEAYRDTREVSVWHRLFPESHSRRVDHRRNSFVAIVPAGAVPGAHPPAEHSAGVRLCGAAREGQCASRGARGTPAWRRQGTRDPWAERGCGGRQGRGAGEECDGRVCQACARHSRAVGGRRFTVVAWHGRGPSQAPGGRCEPEDDGGGCGDHDAGLGSG